MSDYKITLGENKATIEGGMRLKGPSSYDEPFNDIIDGVKGGDYCIDISDLEFLNSSGISKIARLVIMANINKNTLTLVVGKHSWQEKICRSLKMINKDLIVVKR